MEEKRNELDELFFNTLTGLNSLLNSNDLCKDDKAIIKINRFKKWLLEYTTTKQIFN